MGTSPRSENPKNGPLGTFWGFSSTWKDLWHRWQLECKNFGDGLCAVGKVDHMFLTLFVILLVLWILGFGAFHIAGGLIHLLLLLAVISIIVHFVKGHRTI
jgi:hypothetical protein